MTDIYNRIRYHPPNTEWLTLNPLLDPLLKLWRQGQNREEGRQPRWSELAPRLWMPFHRGLVLVRDHGGTRPPFCDTLFPLAADLLGLPRDFHGSHWPDPAQARRIHHLVYRSSRAQVAQSDFIPPVPGTHDLPGDLKAVAVPLAPEETSIHPRDRPILLSIAWPEPE